MTKTLIDATPTSLLPSDKGECMFTFGEGIIGREVGVVYLLAMNPHYTRFKVIAQELKPRVEGDAPSVVPAYQPISERPLTAEEIAHFVALADVMA